MIAEHDSWLAFDPIRGCPNDCGYCFLRLEGLTHSAPVISPASVAELGERYAACARDVPPGVPVSFGNTTDLLSSPRLLDSFCALASEIRRRDPERLFVVITKAKIGAETARRIADAAGGNCLVFLSQSFAGEMGVCVERGKVCTPEETLESARIISQTDGLRCAHFWRPFLSAWNPPERLPERVRALRDSGCRCSVLIGLRASQKVKDCFSELLRAEAAPELGLAPVRGEEYVFSELVDRAIAAATENEYHVFMHTSCAIAYLSGKPDINGTAHSAAAELRCRRANCPAAQRAICLADCPWEENTEYIARCREQYGESLRLEGAEPRLDRPITDYEFNHLLHIFRRTPTVGALIQNKVWKGSVHDNG